MCSSFNDASKKVRKISHSCATQPFKLKNVRKMSVDPTSPPSGQSSFSGIPRAQFVEDVDAFMAAEESAEDKLKSLDEAHQKYKFMEGNLVARRKRLKAQIPDITSSLQVIEKLKGKLKNTVQLQFSHKLENWFPLEHLKAL